MKLVKESLFEFERGLDPKEALGLGREGRIRKCFRDLGIPDGNYEIKPDRVIINKYLYLGDQTITWLPDNLVVNSSADFNNAKITKLPDNLRIDGFYLDLSRAKISELPKGLVIIWGSLYLNHTQITQLPEDLEVGEKIYAVKSQTKLIKSIKNSKFAGQLNIFQ